MGTASPDRVSRVLFGSIRREVLFLLLGRPDEKFYLREIVRAAGGGSGAVQRELKQLVQAGLLNRENRGRQVYFSANRESPVFPELQAVIRKTAGAADVLRGALGTLPVSTRIRVALVHGSIAEGSQTARSDVDLLIVGELDLPDILPSIRAAEKKLGREVNVSLFHPREFRQKRKAANPFLERVIAGEKLFVIGDDRELARLGR